MKDDGGPSPLLLSQSSSYSDVSSITVATWRAWRFIANPIGDIIRGDGEGTKYTYIFIYIPLIMIVMKNNEQENPFPPILRINKCTYIHIEYSLLEEKWKNNKKNDFIISEM